jgi:hypothetical protein
MSSVASISTFTTFALAATGSTTFSRFPKSSCSIGRRGSLMVPDMSTGNRARPVELNRDAAYTVGGDISLNATPANLLYLLPYLTGDATSPFINGDPSGGLLPTFQVAIDKIAQAHSYSGLTVDRLSMSFTRGGFIDTVYSCEGIDEAIGVSAARSQAQLAALSTSLSPPFVFHDCVVTVGGSSYSFAQANLTIDNMLEKNQFFGGSQVRASLPTTDLQVGITLLVPYNATNKALYNLVGAAGAAVVLTATNGSNTLSITLPAVQFPASPIDDPSRGEIMLGLNGTASSSAGGSVYSIAVA